MPPAWRVSANDIAVKGSAHEFVRTPHVHRCRPATVCRCARASVRLVSSLKGSPSGLAKRLCVPPAQGFGAFPCVCHRPKGRLGFSGGVLPSSGQLSPSPVSVFPSGAPCPRPVLLSLSVCLRLPVVLASVQIPPLLSPVRCPCPSVFVSISLRCSCPAGLCPAHPLRRFLSLDLPSPGPLSSSLPSPCSPVSVPRTTASITPLNGTDLLCKWMCLRLCLLALILYFIPPPEPVWLSWPRIRKRRCHFLRTS